ncbi:MAG: hypothetical protein J6Z50_06320 [Fibrobacterales bacterium]|nr:hypothetical protein [Fibrobacterales bacterium]MBP5188730.1 hypothetical protein [Fibrobacterales bacterium]MBP5351402.1 hypothetical protein [Fibrobacterales bacterium]
MKTQELRTLVEASSATMVASHQAKLRMYRNEIDRLIAQPAAPAFPTPRARRRALSRFVPQFVLFWILFR